MDKGKREAKRWRHVRDWVVRQIDSGELTPTAPLPSIRELARLCATSLTTVQRALVDLEAEAYVVAVPRVGYFVAAARQGKPPAPYDFSGVEVQVNQAVVAMLSQAASRPGLALSSAVLHDELTPQVLLNRCLVSLAGKADARLAGLIAPPGDLSLRRRLAGLMLSRGVSAGPDDILITAGDSSALELALEAVAGKGALIAIETPTYYGILQVIERLGMRALPIRTHEASGMDLAQLEEALQTQPVAAIFLNPTLQNPCGFIMPDAQRARLSQLARQAEVPIIEDDIFFDLVPPVVRPRAIKSYDSTGQTLYCASFSKTVAPGYRVGWCLPGRYREAILAQLFARNLAVSSLAQQVLAEFIARGYLDDHCARLRTQFATTRDYLTAFVASHFPRGTRYLPPSGGFIHWLRLPEGTDMAALIALAQTRGCAIAGSGIFFADGRDTHALRLCLGRALTPEVIQGLHVLAQCAQQLGGRPA